MLIGANMPGKERRCHHTKRKAYSLIHDKKLIGKIKPLFEKLGFIKSRNLRQKQSKVNITYIMGFGLSP